MYPKRKLGRPYGSKTFRETPGVKYAREYLELRAFKGKKPLAAARIVAGEKNISESAVFRAYKRHAERLRSDMDKALRANYVWFGRWLIRQHPDLADAFARRYIMEFQSGLDKLATRLDSHGCTVGAQGARTFEPSRFIASEAWLALLGQIYLDFLQPRRNKSIR